LWNVGLRHLVSDAEQVVEHPAEFGRQPQHRLSCPIGEGDDAGTVVGCHEDLRVEARRTQGEKSPSPWGIAPQQDPRRAILSSSTVNG
jgi:hypothetical protein